MGLYIYIDNGKKEATMQKGTVNRKQGNCIYKNTPISQQLS